MSEHPLFVLLGPTASGKTRLAVRLADALGGEIISADSRQVFKGMDIGTGKDLSEYLYNGKLIPYHLIDIREAGSLYNVHEFKEDFYKVLMEVRERAALPILCGGTGMYVHSILQNYAYTAVPIDPALRYELISMDLDELKTRLLAYSSELVQHADLSSHKRLIRAIEIAAYLSTHEFVAPERPKLKAFVAGLRSEVPLRRSRVTERLERRFEEGMIDEVRGLLAAGIDPEVLEFYGLEYKFITAYLKDELSYVELKERLSIAICQFAKRQMTFFRKMEKDGVEIHWFDSVAPEAEQLAQVLDSYRIYLKTQS